MLNIKAAEIESVPKHKCLHLCYSRETSLRHVSFMSLLPR